MSSPDITQALVTETGLMALVVLAGVVVAVGLALWVVEMIVNDRKDEP